ncbi:MAG: tryptophan--tRNA ligase [Candidatus Thermoplasmatota archaeon]
MVLLYYLISMNIRIDPWSSATYHDYAHLRDEFGIEEFSEEYIKKLPNPNKLLRRGVVFGHRDFGVILDAINHRKPWVVLTGLMPSGRMHLGHKMVIDQVIYYQNIGADIFIAVADIEAFATRGLTLKEARDIAISEYITNYIALGLKPCRIYFQSENQDVKDLAYILSKRINLSQMIATYGFNGSSNMTHIFAPLIQTGDILHVQLEKYGGVRPTLVPVGVDQDPHIRLCRDIAQAHRLYNVTKTKDGKIGVFVKIDNNIDKVLDEAEKTLNKLKYNELKRITDYKAIYINDATDKDIKEIDEALAHVEVSYGGYGFLSPCSTYHRFITGLTGEKMSSSKPETAIFLTDKPEEARKKIINAKTGGAATMEEQRRHGGNPNVCVVYELLLYHLIEDDRELNQIYASCANGERTCGECKKHAAVLMTDLLSAIGEERKRSTDKIHEYIK